MTKKNALRKQVAALEKLAGLVEMTPAQAAKVNGGRRHKKHKPKTSNSVTMALGSGAMLINPGTGSGHLLAMPGSGAVAARGTGA